MRRLDDLGEHEHADGRSRLADLLRRSGSLVRVGWRHADVDDRDIGLPLVDRMLQLERVAGLGRT